VFKKIRFIYKNYAVQIDSTEWNGWYLCTNLHGTYPGRLKSSKLDIRIVKYIAHHTHPQVTKNTVETIIMGRNKLTGTGTQQKGKGIKWQTSKM
jgi:hypothetical protein